MGKTKLLDILVILDRSGSMSGAHSDHEGGLRSFVESQRKLPGDVRFTLVQFDSNDPCEVVYDRVLLEDVKDIVLIPRGGTPLLDAIGKATAHLRAKLPTPEDVVVMVITDGHENASTEWTKQGIKDRIADLGKENWAFLFLAANVDTFAEAGGIGVGSAQALGYVNKAFAMGGTAGALYGSVSGTIASNRAAKFTLAHADASVDVPLTDNERVNLMAAASTYTFTEADRTATAEKTTVIPIPDNTGAKQ